MSDEATTEVIEHLGRVLADSSVLYQISRNFHWNVTGPQFHSLHTLFEQQYTDLETAIDEIAERIRALGYAAPGTLNEFLKTSAIDEVEGVPSAEDMVRHLAGANETIAETIKAGFPATEKAEDEATADLLTQRLHIHDKNAWMLRSMVA